MTQLPLAEVPPKDQAADPHDGTAVENRLLLWADYHGEKTGVLDRIKSVV